MAIKEAIKEAIKQSERIGGVRNNKFFLPATIFLLAAFLVSGCAATKKIKDDILGDVSIVKRKIAFFTGVNASGRGGQMLGPLLSSTLKRYIDGCDENILIVDTEEARNRLNGVPLLSSGHRDNLALAQAGRMLGLNAALESTIQDIWFTWEKRGIWGFRDEVPFMKITVGVKVYDIETTATLVNDVFLEEVDLSEGYDMEGDYFTKHQESLVKTALAEVLPQVAEQVCAGLAGVPWKGAVVGREGERYIISAGRDVGLTVGEVLEVCRMGEPIEGVGGEVFLVPGPNMGELRITEVRENHALAVTVSGEGDFEKSCSVMLKQ